MRKKSDFKIGFYNSIILIILWAIISIFQNLCNTHLIISAFKSSKVREHKSFLPAFYQTDETNNSIKPVDTIRTLTPTLKWLNVPLSTGYEVIIKKLTGEDSSKTVFHFIVKHSKDTTLKIPENIIENNNLYSWNVKSNFQFGKSQYGPDRFFFVNIPSAEFPITLRPGFNYPDVEEITDDSINFCWTRLKNVEKFTLLIYKTKHPQRKVTTQDPDIEQSTIDTSITLHSKTLEEGILYQWIVKAKYSNGNILPSKPRFFIIKKYEIPEMIAIVEPQLKSSELNILHHPSPRFVWTRKENVKEYYVILEEISDESHPKKVFDSRGKFQYTDTTFTIPSGIIQENAKYRVTIYGKNDKNDLVSSHRFIITYHKPIETISEKLSSSEEYEEVLFTLKYSNVVNEFINSLIIDDRYYLSLSEFTRILMIPIEFISSQNQFIIPFPDENSPSIIDLSKKKIILDSILLTLRDEDYILIDNTVYLQPTILEKLLRITIKIDLSNLSVIVSSQLPLPIITKLQLERKLLSSSQKKIDKYEPRILFKRKKHFANGFVFDYNLNQLIGAHNKPAYFIDLRFGGEILGGDIKIDRTINYSYNKWESIHSFRWRYVFENEYLNQLVLGDFFDEGDFYYFLRGVKISNEPVIPRESFGKYKLIDKTIPNSIVELYINDNFINITRATEEGFFEFDIPLNYGSSTIELRFFSPEGKSSTSKKVYQIPFQLLPTGELNYSIIGGKINNTRTKIFRGELGYGITNWLTNKISLEYLPDTIKKPNLTLHTSARLTSNYILSFDHSSLSRTRVNLSAIYTSFANLNFSYSKYRFNTFYNPARINEEYNFNFGLPLKFKTSYISTQFSFNKRNFESSNILDTRFYLYSNATRINPFIGLSYQEIKQSRTKSVYNHLFYGSSITLSGLTKSKKYFTGNLINFKLMQSISNKKVESLSLSFSSNITKSLRLQLWSEQNFLGNYKQFIIQLMHELPYVRYWSTSNFETYAQQIIQGSIIYSKEINNIYFNKMHQIDKSSILFSMFEDLNGNGILDKDEKFVKNTDLSSSIPYSKTEYSDGIFIINDLIPYNKYNFNLAEQKSYDLLPLFEQFEVQTEPNSVKVIHLPFYKGGEISGYVYHKSGAIRDPVNGAQVIIQNVNTSKEILLNTFRDGSFYYYGLTPGKYTIKVSEKFLKQFRVNSKPKEIEFEISKDESKKYIDNIILVIE